MNLCEVCRKREADILCASVLVPQSFAQCQECYAAGAEPWDAIVYVGWSAGELGRLTTFAENIVATTLKHLGRSREEYDNAVKAFDAWMNAQEYNQANYDIPPGMKELLDEVDDMESKIVARIEEALASIAKDNDNDFGEN